MPVAFIELVSREANFSEMDAEICNPKFFASGPL
jgi:hypothetical protein